MNNTSVVLRSPPVHFPQSGAANFPSIRGARPVLKHPNTDGVNPLIFRGPGKLDTCSAETTMSNSHLPAEMLDYVVDLLHNTKHALENCCLVPGSWILRTREHLFASIKFHTEVELESWKERFPDPSTSPAHHAKTLIVDCSHVVAAVDGKAGGWITGFSNVVHFEVARTNEERGN